MTRTRRVALTRQSLDTLAAVGLTADQRDVYFDVVTNPVSTAPELSRVSGRTTAAVHRTLSELVAAGLVVHAAGAESRYQAVAPDTALQDRVAVAVRAAEDARRTVDELQHVFRDAVHTAHPAVAVEVLQGAAHIVGRVRRMTSDAREQVRTFDTPPYAVDLDAPIVVQGRPGVTLRGICDREALAIPGRLQGDIADSIRAGEVVRVVAHLPLKMIVSDDECALVTGPERGATLESAYVIRRSSLLDALCALFERYWDVALPLTPGSAPGQRRSGPRRDAPDADTRHLLMLLLAGHTDASLARSLQVSPRTAQRRVSELMATLGVQTRFQAGAAAARRGWL